MTRTAAIDILKEELHHCCEHLTSPNKAPEFYKELGDYCDALRMAIEALEQPEIVHCKDCIWYVIFELKKDGTDDHRYKPSFCELYERLREPDWFCADGKKGEQIR